MSIIYILQRNDRPELCKVGKTIRSAASRGKEYTDGLWRPVKEFSAPHYLLLSIEEKAHQLLKEGGHWLNPEVTDGVAREIFVCDLETAEKAILSAIKIVAQDASEEANNLIDEYNNSEVTAPKKTIRCPSCKTKLKIPSDRRVKFTCFSCGKVFINNNYDSEEGKSRAYWNDF